MIEFLATGIAVLLAVPGFVLLAEVVMAGVPGVPDGSGHAGEAGRSLAQAPGADGADRAGNRDAGRDVPAPRFAVLIPAHNEAGGIAATLGEVIAQLGPRDRAVVVADNCSDKTADIARAAGAIVLERSDSERRGKGYALDHGVRHLEAADPPDVLIIVDADCLLSRHTLDRLARHCQAIGRPVQGRYLMRYPQSARTVGARIAEFAFVVKNWVRPLGLARMDLPCPLLGAGMAFPWAVIRDAQLASGNIVEDMRLGSDLAAAGQGARFLEAASVYSTFPMAAEGQQSQRRRWEHGHLQTLIGEVPRLLARGIRERRFETFAYGLDLAVPPLALLLMVQTLAFGLAALAALLGAGSAPLVVCTAGMAALAVAVLLAWRRFARDVLPLADLLAAPLYMLRKLPVYFRFISARQTAWVRSRRDHE